MDRHKVGYRTQNFNISKSAQPSLLGPLQALPGQRDSKHKKVCRGHHLSLGGASVGLRLPHTLISQAVQARNAHLGKFAKSIISTTLIHKMWPDNHYQGTLTRTFSYVMLFSRMHVSKFVLRNKYSCKGSKCISKLFPPEPITTNHLVSGEELHRNHPGEQRKTRDF